MNSVDNVTLAIIAFVAVLLVMLFGFGLILITAHFQMAAATRDRRWALEDAERKYNAAAERIKHELDTSTNAAKQRSADLHALLQALFDKVTDDRRSNESEHRHLGTLATGNTRILGQLAETLTATDLKRASLETALCESVAAAHADGAIPVVAAPCTVVTMPSPLPSEPTHDY